MATNVLQFIQSRKTISASKKDLYGREVHWRNDKLRGGGMYHLSVADYVCVGLYLIEQGKWTCERLFSYPRPQD